MCGRYLVQSDSDVEEINEIINEVQKNMDSMHQLSLNEIYPTNTAPVIVYSNQHKKFLHMKWGFRKWDNKGVIINARSETVEEKKTFSSAIKQTRCVIPSTGFYEWDKAGGSKQKYLFTEKDSPALYMAGIYSTFRDEEAEYSAFTILTTAANEFMEDIHNRMPVIVHSGEIEDYLTDDKFYKYLFTRDDIKLMRQKA